MKIQIKILIIILIYTLFSNCTFAIQDISKKNDIYTLSDCVSIAVKNSPNVKKTEYNLKIADSNVEIAKSIFFPTIGAGVGIYQEYNSNKFYENGSNYRELPEVGVYLRQLIWDFGKTNSLIKMEKFYKIIAEYEFMDSICNTIHNVKTNYYAVLQAQAMIEVQKNNVEINKRNLVRVKKLQTSGKKSEIDYLNALYHLSESKIKLTEALNNYDLAMADLANSMYCSFKPDFKIEKLDTFNVSDNKTNRLLNKNNNILVSSDMQNSNVNRLDFSIDKSYDIAYANSLDLNVLKYTVNAMEQALMYIKRSFYPELAGGVGYNFVNNKEVSNNGLSLYVNLATSVNIKQLKHEIDRGKARVDLASNDVDLFKQNLYFRVKKCYLNVEKNEKQVIASRNKLKETCESFNSENNRYINNKSDYIAFQKAREDYTNSKIQYVNYLYEYNKSLADLEIAMHYHMDNLHEKAEQELHEKYKYLFNKHKDGTHMHK